MAELKGVPEQGLGEGPGEAGQGSRWVNLQLPKELGYTGKLLAWGNTQHTYMLL